MSGPLVSRLEVRLHEGGIAALVIVALGRGLLGLVLERKLWFFETHIVGCCLLVALLFLSGCLLPRWFGTAVSYLGGLAAWGGAITMLLAVVTLRPRYIWPWYDLSAIAVWFAIACLVAAIALRIWLQRRWVGELQGHGFAWIIEWAKNRAFYPRLLAQRTLNLLGYRGE